MHELMKSAKLANDIMAGAQVKVIGVCKYDLDAKPAKLFGRQRFDSSLRPHWHKGGCLDTTMRGMYLSEPSTGFY